MLGIARNSPLKCSFCCKSEKEVAKLIGGTGVYICDACVGICNKVLEATPETFAGWDKMTDEQLLSGLKTAEATVEGTRAVLQSIIEELTHIRHLALQTLFKAESYTSRTGLFGTTFCVGSLGSSAGFDTRAQTSVC